MADKILIIDDDLETVRLVSVVLQRQGFQVITATNGAEGISLAQLGKPNLIVLDVMMPDMDGYQVTRALRENPETAEIFILMFTAKTQVDDKISGFEAGINDYITKPIHPAELVARIKSMLIPQKKTGPLGTAKQEYSVVVISPSGGLGASTLTLNLAYAMVNKGIKDCIAAEFRPGHGTWGMDMKYPNPEGLNKLLSRKLEEIDGAAVERELTPNPNGLRLLLASSSMNDLSQAFAGDKLQGIFRELLKLSSMTVIDLGNIYLPEYENIISLCKEIVIITEPLPNTCKRTRMLIDDFVAKGLLYSRCLTPVILSRVRSDMTLNVPAVEEILGTEVSHLITPAPELAYIAVVQSVPIMQLQPNSLTAEQIGKLADKIISRAS